MPVPVRLLNYGMLCFSKLSLQDAGRDTALLSEQILLVEMLCRSSEFSQSAELVMDSGLGSAPEVEI